MIRGRPVIVPPSGGFGQEFACRLEGFVGRYLAPPARSSGVKGKILAIMRAAAFFAAKRGNDDHQADEGGIARLAMRGRECMKFARRMAQRLTVAQDSPRRAKESPARDRLRCGT